MTVVTDDLSTVEASLEYGAMSLIEAFAVLTSADPLSDDGARWAEIALARERFTAWADAVLLEALDARLAAITREEGHCVLTRDTRRHRLTDSLTALLSAGWKHIDDLQTTALCLRELPATRQALRDGRISRAHAQKIIDATTHLSPEARTDVERRVLEQLPGLTPHAVTRRVTKLISTFHPAEAIIEMEARRAESRYTRRRGNQDGTSSFEIHGDTEELALADAHVQATASALKAAGDSRPIGDIRYEVALTLLKGDPATVTTTVELHVLVPLSLLAGCDERPVALLDGEPIPPSALRRLCADHSVVLRRVVTDPLTELVTNHETRRYRAPKQLMDNVRYRHPTCVFAGCDRPSFGRGTQIDHHRSWSEGGTTAQHNLGPMCLRHNLVKYARKWEVTQSPDGICHVTSPDGFTRTVHPEPPLNPPIPRAAPPSDEPPPF